MKLLLTKMKTQTGSEIDYFFEYSEKDIHVNAYIGKQISLKWNGRRDCSKCLKQTDNIIILSENSGIERQNNLC